MSRTVVARKPRSANMVAASIKELVSTAVSLTGHSVHRIRVSTKRLLGQLTLKRCARLDSR